MEKNAQAVFDKIGMAEDRFWELVSWTNWPEEGYDRPKLRYLQTLEPEEGRKFRKTLDKLWGVMDSFIGHDRNPAGGGDDSHSDFIYHVIGLGKDIYYTSLENYGLLESRGNMDDFEESFGYAVPYVSDWDDVDKEIADLKKSLERDAEKKSGVQHKYWHQLIGDIDEALSEADGEYVAEIYNKICSEQIEYVEDSVWKVVEKA